MKWPWRRWGFWGRMDRVGGSWGAVVGCQMKVDIALLRGIKLLEIAAELG